MDTKLSEIDLLQLFAVLAPYIVLFASNRLPKKSDFQREQFDRLLVPLMRIFKEDQFGRGTNYSEYASRVKELYLESFQYAPEKLDDKIRSFCKDPRYATFHDLSSESEFLFDSYRKKVIDINKYEKRFMDTVDFAVDFISFFGTFFLPYFTVECWIKYDFSSTLVLLTVELVGAFLLCAHHMYNEWKHKD